MSIIFCANRVKSFAQTVSVSVIMDSLYGMVKIFHKQCDDTAIHLIPQCNAEETYMYTHVYCDVSRWTHIAIQRSQFFSTP